MVQSAEGYAGDVSVEDAYGMLEAHPDATLIDVRTDAEWNFVGLPDLSGLGKEVILIPWQIYPTMEVNPRFVEEVKARAGNADQPVMFLCRSGARSAAAARALAAAGYTAAYNVAGGFEGPLDAEQHRGAVDGWKARGLPWLQR